MQNTHDNTSLFKISLVGTDMFVGRECGGYTAGIDTGKTWTKDEANEAISVLEKYWGKLSLVAA